MSQISAAVQSQVSALSIAIGLHGSQKDLAGRPYWQHCQRVARYLIGRWPDASLEQVQAAYLHDVLEDTAATPGSLLDAGVSYGAIQIIEWVTKPRGWRMEGDFYLDWIAPHRRLGERGCHSGQDRRPDGQHQSRSPAASAEFRGAV